MKQRSALVARAALAVGAAMAVAAFQSRAITRSSSAAFRTIDDAFAVHIDQGWELVTAPTDGRRYRTCGATQSDPMSGVSLISGSFEAAGRSVEFNVEVPEGRIVAVEGLDPLDGGPLEFAVLTRDLPE